MALGKQIKVQRGWRDPRLIIGIVLILGALLAGTMAVHLANRNERYYVAAQTLVVGSPIDPQKLKLVEMNPGQSGTNYLKVGQLSKDRTLNRTVKQGELLPRSALSKEKAGMRSLVLNLGTELPAGTEKGDALELWQLPASAHGSSDVEEQEYAQKLTGHAILRDIRDPSANVAARTKPSIEVVVDQQDLPAVLAAVGRNSQIVAIPGAA